MQNILVLEDNTKINELLVSILKNEGYNVFPSFNAFDALKDFDENRIDCILTDLMLPIMDGETFIKKIREKSSVHIIVISAKTETQNKIEGLKVGADDYIYKPFIKEEIILKLKNLFNKKHSLFYSFNQNEIIFEPGKNQIIVKDETIPLTSYEYYLIKYLIENHGKVISRDSLLNVIYNYNQDVFDRVIDVHIRNIRKKLKKVTNSSIIETVYGLGYRFNGDQDE
jgi:two-component system OmpR family response regulator